MDLSTNHFAQLAAQVRAGHTHVRAQFERELVPGLLRAVNRVLTPGLPLSPQHRSIAAVSRQMHVTSAAGPEERLRLAQALCQRIVNRVAPMDTEVQDDPHTLVA